MERSRSPPPPTRILSRCRRMTYDCETELYVPCAFALVGEKNEYIYCKLVHQLIIINFCVKPEFQESKILGDYFHLKQALQKLNFSQSSPPTRFLLLTHEDAVDKFWQYFERTRPVRFPHNAWNSSEIPQLEIKNRTNNVLERYNKRLSDFFANALRNICSFAEIIRDEFKYYEETCVEIRQNSNGIVFHPSKQLFLPNLMIFIIEHDDYCHAHIKLVSFCIVRFYNILGLGIHIRFI
ncbi:hypothetical protein HZS_1549 [Henneguya salminicola]|nr:hypothetical protein HZS_1549 [Henneguya salminicola]